MFKDLKKKLSTRKSTNFHLKIWTTAGFWPNDERPKWQKFYSIIALTFFYSIFPITLILNVFFVKNLNQVVETFFICFTCAIATFKGTFVYLKRKKLMELFELMDKMDKYLVLPEQREIISGALKYTRNLIIFMCIMYYTSLNLAFLMIFWSKERNLMWVLHWLPANIWRSNTPLYYFIIIFQYIASFHISFIDSSVDTYGAVFCTMLTAHLNSLGFRLQTIGRHKQLQKELQLHGQANSIDRQLEIADRKESEIIFNECIEYHRYCIHFANLLEDILSFPYLVQLGCSGLIICVSTFHLSEIHPLDDLTEFLFLCDYLVSMVLEIFIPCYFGNVVTNMNEELSAKIYASNWIEQTKKFKQSFRIFVERTLEPMIIHAGPGKLFVMGLPTFVAILRAAYSLLACLKTLNTTK